MTNFHGLQEYWESQSGPAGNKEKTNKSKGKMESREVEDNLTDNASKRISGIKEEILPVEQTVPQDEILPATRVHVPDQPKNDAALLLALKDNSKLKVRLVSGEPELTKRKWGFKFRKGTSDASREALETLLGRLSTYAKNGITEIELDDGNTVTISQLKNILAENSWAKRVFKNNPNLNNNLKDLEKLIFFNEVLDDESLNFIMENSINIPKKDDGSFDYRKIYDFLNGVIKLNKELTPIFIGIPQDEYEAYFEQMANMRNEGELNLKVEVQGSAFMQPQLTNERPSPWKVVTQDLSLLPENAQEYIKDLAVLDSRYLSESDEKEMDTFEAAMNAELEPDLRNIFTAGVRQAYDENGFNRGFIYFKPEQTVAGDPYERIYIQMNRSRAHDLTELVLQEIYGHPENYPDIAYIKVAGPQVAERVDGIVIYVGGEDRAAAQEMREKIVDFLKLRQAEDPDLFGSSNLPLKRQHAPGIASAPNLSENRSFTTEMAKAVAAALVHAKNLSELKEGIMQYNFDFE